MLKKLCAQILIKINWYKKYPTSLQGVKENLIFDAKTYLFHGNEITGIVKQMNID